MKRPLRLIVLFLVCVALYTAFFSLLWRPLTARRRRAAAVVEEEEPLQTMAEMDVDRALVAFRFVHCEAIEDEAKILLVYQEDEDSPMNNFLGFLTVDSSGRTRGKYLILSPRSSEFIIGWKDERHIIDFKVEENDSRNYLLEVDFASGDVSLTRLDIEIFPENEPQSQAVADPS